MRSWVRVLDDDQGAERRLAEAECDDQGAEEVGQTVDDVRQCCADADQQLVLVSSLNEWSEGHYLEPDTRFGTAWIEAVRDGRA